MQAPLHMPIEIRRAPNDRERWFALSKALSPGWIALAHVVPDELDERVWIRFHLPDDPQPIECAAILLETPPDDEHSGDAERRSMQITLVQTDEDRVIEYIQSHNPFR